MHTVLCMSRVFLVSPVILLSSLCRSQKVNYSQADYLHTRPAEKHVSLWGLGELRKHTIFVKKKSRNIQQQAKWEEEKFCAEILEQSMGARNRVGIGFLHGLDGLARCDEGPGIT